MFYDIFDFEGVEDDTVRLSASTLNQLFEDTKYNLKDVRKNKIVRPVSIDLLPNEIKNIETLVKKIFDITVTLHENENQNGYDTSLTELGTKNLRKYLAKDYECLLKLKELGLITNAYYENFGSNP